MSFPNEQVGFGKLDLVSTGLSVASTLSSILINPVVGLVFTIVKTLYNLVTGSNKARKARRKAKLTRLVVFNDIGTSLVEEVYGMRIPGWSTELAGPYYEFGVKFYYWQLDPEGPKRRELIDWLKSWGMEPTRFMGGEHVRPEEYLDYALEYVCGPEKYLVGKEILIDRGYEPTQLESLPYSFFVRVFDIINNIRLAITEEQAKLIKKDLETHLSSAGLDPTIIFKGIIPSVPSPTGAVSSVSGQTVFIPEETVQVKRAGFPLLIGGILLSLFLLNGGK